LRRALDHHGPYDDLLSIDDVIEQELILFVTLNVNKNTSRCAPRQDAAAEHSACGREALRERGGTQAANRPLFSVVMDEFAPFGYQNSVRSSTPPGDKHRIPVFDAKLAATAEGRQGVQGRCDVGAEHKDRLRTRMRKQRDISSARPPNTPSRGGHNP